MENFGPYQGVQTIQFAPLSGGTPVTLVDGKNGFGKTSILEAMHWLLYGEEDSMRQTLRINRTATREGSTRMRVELRFRRRGEEHQVIRTLTAPPGVVREHFSEKLTYLVNNQPQQNPVSRVAELLPESASQFFFFDGAKIARYANLENDKAVRDAIEMVLGLPAYEAAVHHLSQLKERWEKAARKEQAQDDASRAKIAELEAAEARRDGLRKTIESGQDQLKKLEDQREGVISKLQRFDSMRERIATLRLKEEEHRRFKEQLSALKAEQAKALRRYAHQHILPLLETALDLKENELAKLRGQQEGRDRRRYVLDFLDAAQQVGTIPEATAIDLRKAVDHLHPETAALGDPAALPRLEVEVAELSEKVKVIRSAESPQETRQRFRTLRAKVSQLETEVSELRRNLGTVDQQEVVDLTQKLELINQRIGAAKSQIDRDESELREAEEMRGNLARAVSQMGSRGRTESLRALAEQARRLSLAFDTILAKARNLKRAEIQDHATAYFRKFTRKPDVYAKLQINPDYTLSVLDVNGLEHRRDTISAGEKQLVALSFIVGLVKSTERTMPLVIDTPFGHLDRLHRENVMRHLPELGQQLVLLVTDADVAREHEGIIGQFVGRKYLISYDQKSQSSALAEVRA